MNVRAAWHQAKSRMRLASRGLATPALHQCRNEWRPCSPKFKPSFFASLLYTPVLVNVLKGLGVVDGEDTEEALPCPHVLIPHGAVLLLTCSVQDVQQAGLPVNHNLFPVRVLSERGEIQRSGGAVKMYEGGICHESQTPNRGLRWTLRQLWVTEVVTSFATQY